MNNILGLPSSDLERFMAKVIRGKESECWMWAGKPSKSGYGKFNVAAMPHPAHRVAYELAIGPIPRGRQVHHKCDNRICVNPRHLEALTVQEHVDKTTGHPKNRTHCKRGHEFNESNTRIYKGIRTCRACVSLRAKRKYNPQYEERPAIVGLYCKNGHPLFGPNLTLRESKLGVRRLCKTCRRDNVHRHKAAHHELVLTQRKARRATEKLKVAQERLSAATNALMGEGVRDPIAMLLKLKRILN